MNNIIVEFCPFCEEDTWLNILGIDWNKHRVYLECLICGEKFKKQCYLLQELLAPTEERWKIRSRTFPGIANAMAEQWG